MFDMKQFSNTLCCSICFILCQLQTYTKHLENLKLFKKKNLRGNCYKTKTKHGTTSPRCPSFICDECT